MYILKHDCLYPQAAPRPEDVGTLGMLGLAHESTQTSIRHCGRVSAVQSCRRPSPSRPCVRRDPKLDFRATSVARRSLVRVAFAERRHRRETAHSAGDCRLTQKLQRAAEKRSDHPCYSEEAEEFLKPRINTVNTVYNRVGHTIDGRGRLPDKTYKDALLITTNNY